jgi:hypothetical protein
VAVGADGSAVFTVAPSTMIDFGEGPSTITPALVKLDKDGNFAWSAGCEALEADSKVTFDGIAVDVEGSVVMIGTHVGDIDCGTGPITPVNPGTRALMLKLSAAGVPQWSKTFGVALGAPPVFNAVAADSAGSIVAAGGFSYNINFGLCAHASSLSGVVRRNAA